MSGSRSWFGKAARDVAEITKEYVEGIDRVKISDARKRLREEVRAEEYRRLLGQMTRVCLESLLTSQSEPTSDLALTQFKKGYRKLCLAVERLSKADGELDKLT